MKRILSLVLLFLLAATCQAQIAIGKWRDHLSYTSLKKVCVAGDRVYAAANGGLLYYDLDDLTLNRINKTNQLNDVGISTIAYDPATRHLVVAYSNANIDLVKDGQVTNLSDIKRNDIGGSKEINNIRFHNHCAYLACGFGVVVVDLARHEIKETYYLGPDGTYRNINDIAFTDRYIVAATDEGLMYADKESTLLNIVGNWTADESSLLAGRRVTMLAVDDNSQLLAVARDEGDTTATLYRESGSMTFAPWQEGDIKALKYSQGKILTTYRDHLTVHDADGQLLNDLRTLDWMTVETSDADLTADGRLWMAHNWASLCFCRLDDPAGTLTALTPQCPYTDDNYRLTSFNDNLYVAPGGHRTTYVGVYNPANVYTFSNNNWSHLNDPDGLLNGAMDVLGVSVNPKNSHQAVAASWNSGLIEITDNTVTARYDSGNSDGALSPYTEGSYSVLLTGGVAYDKRGNLWATVSLQPNGLAVRRVDGSWQSFYTQDMVAGSDIDQLICDSIRGLKLFWGRANKIFVHDGDSLMAYIDPNNGAKLETSSVHCVVQDHNGNLWIGTNKGIKVVYDLGRVFQNGGRGEKSPVTCSNILFSENGINEYLLAYENVTSIFVDGANRKWVGTASGGLYLISANGQSQLQHFTAANSPLFSDKIVSLAVMPWSGELFIGTDKGLQSYRADATYAYAAPQSDIHAFPNPVRPDYDGPIAIKGFTRNGIVHITDAAGHTVYSTTANGGQAIWYGRTNSGERVASGVYYVFASAEDGQNRSVAKILIIR